jgi:hypothetical protein
MKYLLTLFPAGWLFTPFSLSQFNPLWQLHRWNKWNIFLILPFLFFQCAECIYMTYTVSVKISWNVLYFHNTSILLIVAFYWKWMGVGEANLAQPFSGVYTFTIIVHLLNVLFTNCSILFVCSSLDVGLVWLLYIYLYPCYSLHSILFPCGDWHRVHLYVSRWFTKYLFLTSQESVLSFIVGVYHHNILFFLFYYSHLCCPSTVLITSCIKCSFYGVSFD